MAKSSNIPTRSRSTSERKLGVRGHSAGDFRFFLHDFCGSIWSNRFFYLPLHQQKRNSDFGRDEIPRCGGGRLSLNRGEERVAKAYYRGVEQLAARWAHNPKVGGSSPPSATQTDKSRDLSVFFFIAPQNNNGAPTVRRPVVSYMTIIVRT